MDAKRVKYKVIEEHGIVIAEIKYTTWDAINEFNKRFMAHSTSKLELCGCFDEHFCMPNSFKAIAKCHEDDVFDENVGKRIALNKLIDKYERSKNNKFARIMLVFDKTLKALDKYFETREF